jgi:hypothetical protein
MTWSHAAGQVDVLVCDRQPRGSRTSRSSPEKWWGDTQAICAGGYEPRFRRAHLYCPKTVPNDPKGRQLGRRLQGPVPRQQRFLLLPLYHLRPSRFIPGAPPTLSWASGGCAYDVDDFPGAVSGHLT